MDKFWLIPIIALLMGSIMGGNAVYEKYTVIIPKAEIELELLQQMSCPEIKARNAMGSYYIPSNGVYARETLDSCLVMENAIKEKERMRLAKLYADPNSQESLERKLIELVEIENQYMLKYAEHSSQAKILKGNITNFHKEIDITTQKMSDFGFLDEKNCFSWDLGDGSSMGSMVMEICL